MTQRSTHLSLPFVMEGQAQKHVTVNEALEALDAVVQLAVEGVADAPPATPAEGARWIVGAGGSGEWAGRAGRLAVRRGTGAGGWWAFLEAAPGWTAWDLAAGRALVRTASGWIPASVTRAERLGVATEADATNRLSVASPATLLSHAGSDHRLTLNKAGASDTASLVMQSGWSGRAEIGLAGGDDLSVKASADGGAWVEALRVARAGGQVALPRGAYGALVAVARGSVARLEAPAPAGFCLVAAQGAAAPLDASGIVAFQTGAAPTALPVWSGASFGTLPAGAPTGTTGPNGAVGLAAHSDGALHLENRHATATAFSVTWLGCAPA